MAYDNFLIDKRVVERNIKKGLVDPESLKQQIEGLPDREANCVHVSLEGTGQTAHEDVDDVLDAAAEDELDDEDEGEEEEDEDEDDESEDSRPTESEG